MHANDPQNRKPELVIETGSDSAIAEVVLRLAADRVRARRSFQLDEACASLADNICPHNGHSPCECRLSVLNLRDGRDRSATLIAYENGRLTEFYFVDGADPEPQPGFEDQIRTALVSLARPDGPAH